jgi:hypothetical protein
LWIETQPRKYAIFTRSNQCGIEESSSAGVFKTLCPEWRTKRSSDLKAFVHIRDSDGWSDEWQAACATEEVFDMDKYRSSKASRPIDGVPTL